MTYKYLKRLQYLTSRYKGKLATDEKSAILFSELCFSCKKKREKDSTIRN